MIRACDEAGVKLFVVKQNRFNVPVVKAREALEAGRFGRLILGTVRVRWCRDQAYYDQDAWRGTWAYDGGVLTNQASHHIDMLEWFFGDVVSVHARAITALAKIETEDTAVATLKFRNGALGIIEATTAARPTDLEGSLSILGEKGTVEIAGFAVNQIRHWRFVEELAVGQGSDREIFGQSAERLRLRPSGLLSACDRLPGASARRAGGRPRGAQEPRADLRALRIDRDRPGGRRCISRRGCAGSVWRREPARHPSGRRARRRIRRAGQDRRALQSLWLQDRRRLLRRPVHRNPEGRAWSARAPACSRMPSSANW